MLAWLGWKTGEVDRDLRPRKSKGATTQYTHYSPEGSVGECATGQTQGALPSGNRPRVRHPPKHRPQVRLGQKPATEKHQWHDWDTIIQGGRLRLIGHFRRPIGRTLSLDINTGGPPFERGPGGGQPLRRHPAEKGLNDADVAGWFEFARCGSLFRSSDQGIAYIPFGKRLANPGSNF